MGERVRRSGTAHPWGATSWNEASLPLPKGGAGPGFCPKSSCESVAALRFITRAGPGASGDRGLYLRKTLAALGPIGYLAIIF